MKRILALCGFQNARFCRSTDDIEYQPTNGKGLEFGSFRSRGSDALTEHEILHRAAIEGDWETAEPILRRNVDFARHRITRSGEALFQVAVEAKRAKFVQELLKMLDPIESSQQKNDSSQHTSSFVDTVHEILRGAAMDGNWNIAEPILKHNLDYARRKISRAGETLLHIAVAAGSVSFVDELLNMLEPDDLELRNDCQRTAFVDAVEMGDVKLAKMMVGKNDRLTTIYAYEEVVPLQVAILTNQEEMFSYLYKVTPFQKLTIWIKSILWKPLFNMINKALEILKEHGSLATSKLPKRNSFLRVLIRKQHEHQDGTWHKLLHATPCAMKGRQNLRKKVGELFEEICKVWLSLAEEELTKLMKSTEILHYAAKEGNAEFLATVLHKKPVLSLVLNKKGRTIFHVAVSQRQEEVFSLIYNIGPFKELIHQVVDEDGNNILHLAAILGQPVADKYAEVYKIPHGTNENSINMSHDMFPFSKGESYEVWSIKMTTLFKSHDLWDLVENGFDDSDKDDEMLKEIRRKDSRALFFIQQAVHEPLFSKIAKATTSKEAWAILTNEPQVSPKFQYKLEQVGVKGVQETEKLLPRKLIRVSGAALQLHREILWFEEVKKVVPPTYCKMINGDNKSPEELFLIEHKALAKEGERWMRETANSCMIVATLIATVVFAAAFTVPGGYDQNTGIPILIKRRTFTVFTVADSVAMVFSIMSIMMFLSILTSRYQKHDFRSGLPAKLLLGLAALFVSVVGMIGAFTTAFFLVYRKKWEPILTAALAILLFILFLYLNWQLLFDMIRSIRGSIFGSAPLFKPSSKLMIYSRKEFKKC